MKLRGTNDWYGNPSPWNPEMALAIEGERLSFHFRADKAPFYDRSFGPLDFVEGLWEQDVAEIFLAGPNGRYQEINLSPTGAWWSAVFSEYRVRESEVEFPVEIEAERREDRWEVQFSTALKNLEVWNAVPRSQYRASATAILYAPDPVFFAWNHNTGGEPDFHRADLFRPL